MDIDMTTEGDKKVVTVWDVERFDLHSPTGHVALLNIIWGAIDLSCQVRVSSDDPEISS